YLKEWTLSQDISIADYHGIPINCVTLHSSGRRLLVHYRDSVLRVVNLRILRVMQTYIGALNFRKNVRSCLSPCGSLVVSGSEDSCVYVWDTDTGEHLYKYSSMKYQQPVTGVHYHPRDHILAMCSPGRNQAVFLFKYTPTTAKETQSQPSLMNIPATTTSTTTPVKTVETSTPTDTPPMSSRKLLSDMEDEDHHEDRRRYEKILRKLNSVPDFTPSLFSSGVSLEMASPAGSGSPRHNSQLPPLQSRGVLNRSGTSENKFTIKDAERTRHSLQDVRLLRGRKSTQKSMSLRTLPEDPKGNTS
ncbi:hypothetical protein Ahia01_001001800, partial [Argonauta hians]